MGNFFLLWFAIRRTATIDHIIGEDTLEMSPELDDRSCPWFGKIPLPPVMIQQLDMILTLGVLNPLREQVLEDFQKLLLANRPQSWMTMYLMVCSCTVWLCCLKKVMRMQEDTGFRYCPLSHLYLYYICTMP